MSDVEVHIDIQGQVHRLGLLRRQLSRRGDAVTFEYDAGWLKSANKFSLEPALDAVCRSTPCATGRAAGV